MNIRDILNKKTFYDSHVNFSERTLIDYEISPGTNAKFNIIKNQLGKRQFDRAIDIGCSGNSILPFLDNIQQRFYLDIARVPLRQFSHIRANFPLVSVLEKMALKTESFDLVTALDVLEHVKDDKGAIQELYRILKPGGILLLSVPHRMKFSIGKTISLKCHYPCQQLNLAVLSFHTLEKTMPHSLYSPFL